MAVEYKEPTHIDCIRNRGKPWSTLTEDQFPDWVKRAADKFELHYSNGRPYDVTKHFVGRTFVYRVFYEAAGQGQVERHYYKKKK